MDKIRNIFFNRNIGIVILGSVILLFASMIYFKVLYPKISEKSFFIAETFSTNGYHEKSLKELNKCLLLNIFDSKIYHKKADIYLEIGKNRAALTNYNMAIFLNKYNIPNFKVVSENHIWNAVYLDGKWYHLDLTWDDPVLTDGSDTLEYTFFLITTPELEELETNQHVFDKKVFKELA